MSREVEAYLQRIEENLFICPKKKRHAFLRDFCGSLNAYIEEHPAASVQELQGMFGSPEEIAESFLQSEQFDHSKKVFSSKKRVSRIILIAVCVLVAAALILGTIYVVETHRYAHGYWVETPVEDGRSTPIPDAIYIN